MKLEYYYLFGLDIPLEEFGLGKIKQPKINDFLSKRIDLENFHYPFLLNEMVIGNSKDKDNIVSIKNRLGALTFLLFNIIQFKRSDLLHLLEKSLSILYDCENIEIVNNDKILVGDIVIDNSNFELLSNVILESQRIDKSKLDFTVEEKKELDPISARFEELRKKHREKTKKKNEVELIDLINSLIHSNECCMDYDKVLNMTMYQLRNSLETLGYKNNYETMMRYKLSPKFDMKDDIKDWNFKKIVKSSSIEKDA